jgi:heterodisulfide reductase subunit A-like polyferredoxin
VGQYRTIVRDAAGTEQTIDDGVVIFATGGREYAGDKFGLGTHNRVCTQRELEAMLAGRQDVGSTVVMIQCVGEIARVQGAFEADQVAQLPEQDQDSRDHQATL